MYINIYIYICICVDLKRLVKIVVQLASTDNGKDRYIIISTEIGKDRCTV